MKKTYMTPAVEIHRIQTETLICLSRFDGAASGDDALVKRRRKTVDDLDLFDDVKNEILDDEEEEDF